MTETDPLGHTTKYFYDSTNGELLAQINVDEGNGYVYEYNEWGVLESVMPATGSATSYSGITNAESVSYNYNPNTHRLSSITTDTTTYTFSYDIFGNSTSATAGNSTLATYEYKSNNGKIEKINYGNGFSEDYVYDTLEMLSEIWYTVGGTRTKAYSYTYNKDGTLSKFENHLDGTTIEYEYDVHGRFISASETSSSDSNYRNEYEVNNYDADGRVTRTTNTINYLANSVYTPLSVGYQYTYNNDGTLKEERILSSAVPTTIVDYYYDSFNRTTKVDRRIDGFRYTTEYSYYFDSNKTNELISEVSNTINGTKTTYNYTYDSNGNITKIVIGDKEIRYTYDNLGQLLREENELVNQSFTYTYDNAGNIKSKKVCNLTTGVVASNQQYSYSSSAWGDRLSAFGSTGPITYDEIGNPLTYNNGTTYHFTWAGRQLTRAAVGNSNYTFTYNDEGIRTSKTLPSGTRVEYVLNGSQIVAEMTDTYTIVYMYDANGSPIGMKHRLSSYAAGVFNIFWFEKNLQGDIVAVYNSDGVKCISYIYDAWGKILKTTTHNSTGTNAYASRNPFRYRGYYYDTDLKLYYLQSRYYDPITCRFISPDNEAVLTATPMALTDKNLYAYCDNNPVTRVDGDGEFWHIIAGAAIGGVIGGVSKVITNLIAGKDNIGDGVFIAFLTGAASGALAATGVGLVGQIAGCATIAMAGNAAQQGIDITQGERQSFDFAEVLVDGAIGAFGGLIGGSGASIGNSKSALSYGSRLAGKIFNGNNLSRGLSYYGKEVSKAFAYYGKNMMNGMGQSIYQELGKALGRSGLSTLVVNSANSIYGRWFK